jgi:hypothetical protein
MNPLKMLKQRIEMTIRGDRKLGVGVPFGIPPKTILDPGIELLEMFIQGREDTRGFGNESSGARPGSMFAADCLQEGMFDDIGMAEMPTGREIVKEIEISSLKAQAQQLAAHVIYLDDQLRSVMEDADEAAKDAKNSQDRLRKAISLRRASAATTQEIHKMAERKLFDALSRIDQLEKALESANLTFEGAQHQLGVVANILTETTGDDPAATLQQIGETLCASVDKLFPEGACSEIISRKSLIVAADATENSPTTAEIPTDTAEATIVGATEEIKPPTFLCGKKEICD